MCFVRISEQTATFALYDIKRLVFITEVESVYSAVRTESLYKRNSFVFRGLNLRESTCKSCFKIIYSMNFESIFPFNVLTKYIYLVPEIQILCNYVE
jgi:hypothetical protein